MDERSRMEESKSLISLNASLFLKEFADEIDLVEKIKETRGIIDLESLSSSARDFAEFSTEYKIYEMAARKAEEIDYEFSIEFCDDGMEDYVEDLMLLMMPKIRAEMEKKKEMAREYLDAMKIYYIEKKDGIRTFVKNDCQMSLLDFGNVKETGGGVLCLT